ncbi:major facilitator superfamily domain-containing protein [Haematococcus lacustris]
MTGASGGNPGAFRVMLDTGLWRFFPFMLLYSVGFATLFPVVPTIVTNGFASQTAGFLIKCEDFTPATAPPACQNAHAQAVTWSSWTSFVSGSILSFLCAPSVGSLSDHWGRKPFMLAGISLAGLPMVALTLHLWGWLAIQWYYPLSALNGMVSSFSVTVVSMADLLQQQHRTTAVGYLSACFSVGIMVGPLLGGYISAVAAVYVCTIMIATTGLYVLLFVPETAPRRCASTARLHAAWKQAAAEAEAGGHGSGVDAGSVQGGKASWAVGTEEQEPLLHAVVCLQDSDSRPATPPPPSLHTGSSNVEQQQQQQAGSVLGQPTLLLQQRQGRAAGSREQLVLELMDPVGGVVPHVHEPPLVDSILMAAGLTSSGQPVGPAEGGAPCEAEQGPTGKAAGWGPGNESHPAKGSVWAVGDEQGLETTPLLQEGQAEDGVRAAVESVRKRAGRAALGSGGGGQSQLGGRAASIATGFRIIWASAWYRKLALIFIIVAMASEGAQDMLFQYLQLQLGFNTKDTSLLLVVLAVCGLSIKLLLLSSLVRVLGERWLLALGLTAYMVQDVLLALAPTKAAALAAVALGSWACVCWPTTMALQTSRVSPLEMGAVSGALSGISSLATGVGPLLFAALFSATSRTDGSLPYMPQVVWYLAAALTLGAILLTISLDTRPATPPATSRLVPRPPTQPPSPKATAPSITSAPPPLGYEPPQPVEGRAGAALV